MQTKNSLRIGINKLTLSSSQVTLQKSTKYKLNLLFYMCFYISIVGVFSTLLVLINQPLFHWPKDFIGWLCLVVIGIAPFYFFGKVFSLYYNELRPYQISKNETFVTLNGKIFASLSETSLLVIKRVGWQGLGVCYVIKLKTKWKKHTLSFGNSKDEATEVASLISNHFGLHIERM